MTFPLQFGYIVLTTSAGIMDHEEARRKSVGGKVLGFFYWSWWGSCFNIIIPSFNRSLFPFLFLFVGGKFNVEVASAYTSCSLSLLWLCFADLEHLKIVVFRNAGDVLWFGFYVGEYNFDLWGNKLGFFDSKLYIHLNFLLFGKAIYLTFYKITCALHAAWCLGRVT